NMGLNPQQCRKNQTGPLHKKKTPKVSNGLSLEYCKNNHHQLHSDQENNPQLVHRHGKRKKKHHKKKHAWLKPGHNNCKDSDSPCGESKPSIRSSSRERLTDCDTKSDQDDKVSDACSERFFSTVAVK
ncbi:hypothetical protein fugu_008844, partial [Takifugu bimaculatus]